MNDQDEKTVEVPAGEVIKPIVNALIDAHGHELFKIISTGDIAVAVYRPDAEFAREIAQVHPDIFPGLAAWPELGVARMSERLRKGLRNSDAVTSRWLSGGRKGRVFVFAQGGSLLLNAPDPADPTTGWYMEPGSSDGGLKAGAS